MKLCFLIGAVALTLTGCQNDPNYHSGFTNGGSRRKGERVEEIEASRPTPTPANAFHQTVDAAGQPIDR